MTSPAIIWPTDEQIDVAAEWLKINDGDLGEMQACRAVRAFLFALQADRSIKREARRQVVPIKAARQRLAHLYKAD